MAPASRHRRGLRIHEKNPQLTYTLLERRERIGGTGPVSLPGIRSDSDIFTLSYSYEPWTRPENMRRCGHPRVSDGDCPQNGIDSHIRSIPTCSRRTGTGTTLDRRSSGWYRDLTWLSSHGILQYDDLQLPGLEDFPRVVHPQYWPESLTHRQAARRDRQWRAPSPP